MDVQLRVPVPAGVRPGPWRSPARSGRSCCFIQVVLVVVAAVALVFGYLGSAAYVAAHPAAGLGARWWDLLYYDLQLFVLGSDPVDAGPPYGYLLEIGRFSAAFVSVSAIVVGGVVLLDASLRRLRRRHSRGRIIVVGDGAEATAIAARFAEADQQRRPVLSIATGDEQSLLSVGIARATMVIACGRDELDAGSGRERTQESVTNVATARTALRLHPEPGLTVHMMVSDPALALALRARRLVEADNDDRPVRIFTLDELAARHHIRAADFGDEEQPHVAVVGGTTFGRAIIVELALRRRGTHGQHAAAVPVTLVDPRASAVIEEIVERYPFVAQACALTPMEQPLSAALRIMGAPYRFYMCHDDERAALSSALTAAGRWQPARKSIVVRLNQLSSHSDAFVGQDLFDDLDGGLDVVTVPAAAAQELARAEDPMVDLARGIHQRYLQDAFKRGAIPGSGPAMVEWEALPADLRSANIAQAQDFPRKLRQIRCTVAPRSRTTPTFVYRDDEVEPLAIAEHTRWMSERMASGWSYGPERDNAKKIHPMLVSWDQLSPAMRGIDRDMVREVPLTYDGALELQGLQIVRLAPDGPRPPTPLMLEDEMSGELLERLASAIHERYRAGMSTGRPEVLVPWAELADGFKQANRGQARDIGRKLSMIRAFVTRDEPPTRFEFTPGEVELLSQHEHRRWMQERAEQGWTFGAVRDDATKQHPSMVEWGFLDEPNRDKDRDAVLGIPAILADAGYFIDRRPKPEK